MLKQCRGAESGLLIGDLLVDAVLAVRTLKTNMEGVVGVCCFWSSLQPATASADP